jgi:hypothetical protein
MANENKEGQTIKHSEFPKASCVILPFCFDIGIHLFQRRPTAAKLRTVALILLALCFK